MEVIRHQHIRMQVDAKLLRVFFKQISKILMIRRGFKDSLTVVASLNHVMRIAGEREAGKTGHFLVVCKWKSNFNWSLTPIKIR